MLADSTHHSDSKPRIAVGSRTDCAAAIDAWLVRHGGPRRFERGLMTGFHGAAYLLRRYGFELWRYGNRYRISCNGGCWQPISRREIVGLMDALRVLKGQEPIQRPRP